MENKINKKILISESVLTVKPIFEEQKDKETYKFIVCSISKEK